jgi:O-methyltransferase involved in polyketide biosynthesis
VLDLRRRIYPGRPNTTMIGASVTDPDWMADVPADRPTLVVAEGLTMYLEPEAGRALLRRLADRFPSGEMFFDAYNTLGIRLQKANSVVRRAKATLRWGIDDPAELADLGLTLISRRTAEGFVFTEDMDRLPAATRLLYGAMVKIPLIRNLGQLLHYRF